MPQSGPHEETLLALWRESRVTSLDQAAAWTVDRLEADAQPDALPIDLDAILVETPLELARTLRHGSLRNPRHHRRPRDRQLGCV
jgi:hypothetical protein